MEEIYDYDFPFLVSIIGNDDFNDKFLILLLAQSGYKIKHIILGCAKSKVVSVNECYKRHELPETITNKSLIPELIEDSFVVVINNYIVFKKYSNLEDLKMKLNANNIPIIMNQKFEVYIPELKKYYTIFDDKELLSFSGVLGSLRPQHEYIPPYVPKVNLFVRINII